MKLQSIDFAALKLPVLVLAVTAFAGAGLVYWTTHKIAAEKRELTVQEGRLRDARTRYQQSGDERDVIVRYVGPYKQLQSTGLIGPEQRINWLDALRIANQQTRTFGAEYQISAQQPYESARELNAQGLGLAQSIMQLSLRLAHEGELMRFLRGLAEQRAGTFDINQCVLDRLSGIPAPGSLPRLQPNLHADCELAWITINPEPAKERRP